MNQLNATQKISNTIDGLGKMIERSCSVVRLNLVHAGGEFNNDKMAMKLNCTMRTSYIQ